MSAHPLQSALDALDDEAHRLTVEFGEAIAKYHDRREQLVQQMASSPTLAPDVPDHAADILSQPMVEEPAAAPAEDSRKLS